MTISSSTTQRLDRDPRAAASRHTRVLPLVAGTTWLVFTAAQGLLPEQDQPFVRVSDYLLEALFAIALFAAAAAASALPALGLVDGSGRFARAAVRTHALGLALAGVAAAHTLGLGRDALGPVFFTGLLLTLVGGVLLSVTATRAGVLPKPMALGFAAAMPLSMAIGAWGPLTLAVLWGAVALAVTRR